MRLAVLILLLLSGPALAACPATLHYQGRLLHSESTLDLCEASQQARLVLIVNTASQCGYTPQFRQLETLHQRYRDQGLVVVGFPSGDFRQEYQDESRTANVCFVNYGVTFPVYAPSHVRGQQANPVFSALAGASRAPDWNFNKYLLNTNGELLHHWRASTAPLDSDIETAIRARLAIPESR